MVRSKRREKALKACRHCRRSFEGRANADHCSERCRKAAWRAKEKQEVQRLQSLVATLAREVGLRVEDSE